MAFKTNENRRIRVYRQHGPKTATPASLSIQYPTGRASKLPTKLLPPSRPAVNGNLSKTITKKSKKSIQRPYLYLSSCWPIRRTSDIWDRLVGSPIGEKEDMCLTDTARTLFVSSRLLRRRKGATTTEKNVSRSVDRVVSEIEIVRESNEPKRACVVMTYVCNGFYVSSFLCKRWRQMRDASWPNSSHASSVKSQPQIRQRVNPKIWPVSSISWSRKHAVSKSANRTPITTRQITTTATTTTDRGSDPFTSSIECLARSWAAIRCHPNYLRPAKEEPPFKWARPCPT